MFNSPDGGVPWDDLRKILPGCHQVTNVLNGLETLPKVSIGWVGCTNVTDDRQTDDRQTGGRRHIANVNMSSRSLKIGPSVLPGHRIETSKDRTGQSKKCHRGNISAISGEAPTVPIETKICMAGNLADIIRYAKSQGSTILQGSNFPFLLIFARSLQQCSPNALPTG